MDMRHNKLFGNDALFPVWALALWAVALPLLLTQCRFSQGIMNEGNRVTTPQHYPTPRPTPK